MSEEPLANKSQLQPALPDADYDIIYATVSETAQGRRFLEAHARRCRPAEPEASLAAIERMQAAIRQGGASERLDLLLEMADMAQTIVRMRAEILAIKPPGGGALDATEELDSIVQTTESATSRILTAAEQVQEIAWTMRESGRIEALCDKLDARASEIYTACSFQDLTGQRTRKVIQLLRYLEDRINTIVGARDKASTAEAADDPSLASSLVQAGVDAVMQPENNERQENREDATLEDISRLMLAIEPAIGSQQAESPEQPDAAVVRSVEDVRPELSVAETVMAEADAARRLADWAVEPAALKPVAAADAEAALPLTEWIVEDPAAPQPDSEPAWMILRRLEAELDEPPEAVAEPQASAFVAAPPIPAVPAVPVMAEPVMPKPPAAAEPGLFVAEAMSQLAQTLRPVPLLPPAELVFRAKPIEPPADALAELEGAMAATEMKLLQPGEATETAAAAAAPQPDPDDFLFAPQARHAGEFPPLEMRQGLHEALQGAAAKEPAASAVAEWEAGTFPDPALVTPETLPPPEAEQPKADAAHDPLAPLRAMSDAQKIALFS
jgi:chemotaxis protein CheZ